MWNILIHKLNYQRWEVRRWTETSICGDIWLLTVSWSQPLPIWSEHRTQINWAALWSHILQWCKCGYGSKIERVRMHSSGIGGELALWDPSKILAGEGYVHLHPPWPLHPPEPRFDSLILRNTTHTGPVRGLDFNPIQTSLLASGGVSGEVWCQYRRWF